jgi:hypothetical protein
MVEGVTLMTVLVPVVVAVAAVAMGEAVPVTELPERAVEAGQ